MEKRYLAKIIATDNEGLQMVSACTAGAKVKGLYMSLKRIFSCHPIKFLGGGEGFDPVNKNMKAKK